MRTLYEVFHREIALLKKEYALEGRSIAMLDYPLAPFFCVENTIPQVKEILPIEKELLPYEEFYIEIEKSLLFVFWCKHPEEGEGLALNLLNGYVKSLYTMAYSCFFHNHRVSKVFIPRSSEEANKNLASLLRDNEEDFIKVFQTAYWVLYDFLFYLKTPVLKQTKIDLPSKRRLRKEETEEENGELKKKETEFISYTKVSIKKEYAQSFKYENSGSEETSDSSKRFHWCRGHFKYYTKERPLFGRVSGPVWTPSHTRGDAKKGVVFKDYIVKNNLTEDK